MGSESQKKVPIIDLTKEIERGSEEWNEVSKRVRESCEDYGCFEVIYDQILSELREEFFSLTKGLFELPLEIKKKNTNPKVYMAYSPPNPVLPLLESFGIEDASNFDSIQGFAKLMYGDDDVAAQDHFCKIYSTLVKQLNDLHQTIRNLIVDSYGLGKNSETMATMATKTLLRTLKYKPSPPGENILGAYAHTDKPLCTILGEDGSSGLEIETKIDGEWIQWLPSVPNSYIFIVGDPLMVWSNRRLHSVKHKVIMKGEKDRYSLASFLFPLDGTIIKPEEELIDEDHPRVFKEFDIMDFLNFCYSSAESPSIDSDKQVYVFAGV
ncbi:probable inactive 2-oxoglutarate-dependent dioxygenase AOP2 [Euphorbia lathyris]|uniref:probable inactive 2-oxoglutarate-dependent dioxygenase AOP2 n=1 Tax=Euphorbia lathyris TaxID=212925 RepID=UPI0033133E5A